MLDIMTETQKMKATDLFETATCGRCAGSGHYSFNLMHGTVCFGCGGSGIKLTKRGAAAKTAWIAAYRKTIRVSEIVAGNKVMIADARRGKNVCMTVTLSAPYALQAPRWQLDFEPGKGITSYVSASGDEMMDLPASYDEKRAAYETIRHMPGAIAAKEVY
jgi:hypothetical protein